MNIKYEQLVKLVYDLQKRVQVLEEREKLRTCTEDMIENAESTIQDEDHPELKKFLDE